MQRLHEWKADMLTLRDLEIMRQRHARMPKRKTNARTKNGIWYHQKSAEVIVVVGDEPLEKTEVSQNSEGLNVKWLPI